MSESRDDGDRRPSGSDSGGRSSWAEATRRPTASGQPSSGQPSSGKSTGSSQSSSGQSSSGPSSSGQSSSGPSSGSQSSSRQNSRQGSKPASKPAGKQASDPVADFQRWLMRAGARSMANQVADNVRRTLGQQRRESSGDVWDTATTEPPQDEPPECQWCPVCQAARRLRESGPGLSAKLADAGGVLASAVQDAFSAVDQIMKTSSERPAAHPPASAPATGSSAQDGDSQENRPGQANDT